MQGSLETLRRRNTILGIIIVVFLIFVLRLAFLQLFNDKYKDFADSNAFYKKTTYPARGLIYDRNGALMVFNEPSYDVLITVREVAPFDTLDFCVTVGITKDDFLRQLEAIKNRRLNPGYSSYTPQVFLSQLSTETYGMLQEKMFRFKGFTVRSRPLRAYMKPVAAHALGYVAEVDPRDIEGDPYYVPGDYNGRSGIEKTYEPYLRGEKGVQVLLRDAHGRIKGRYEQGKRDIKAEPGKDLTLSIDLELQAYAEQLMANKRGAIVAIEPATGEILTYVSAPTYDPGLLVGRSRASNYKKLEVSPQKIFLNRPIQSNYPPGSTFKPAQGLVYLQEGILTTSTLVGCSNGYFYAPGRKVGCHSHASPLAMVGAVANSCNAYFCYGYRNLIDSRKYENVQEAMDTWKDHMVSMGFGYKVGVDLPFEKRGLIPNSQYYNKWYGAKGWRGSTVISNAIGQGEVLTTPLQLANFCAIVANRGWYITPHLVKDVEGQRLDPKYTMRHMTTIDSSHFAPIVEGMRGAAAYGTARAAMIEGIEVCGKTGTAENPPFPDHSIFICFAPADDPKIAMLVFIENGGFGATWAVPLASLLLEKYLKGSIAPNRKWVEDRLFNAENLLRFVPN